MDLSGRLLGMISTMVSVWSFLTWWIYALITKPGARRQRSARQRAEVVARTSSSVTYRPVTSQNSQLITEFIDGGSNTMAEAWDWAVARYGGKSLLGTRELLGEEDEVQTTGKLFRKQVIGIYVLYFGYHIGCYWNST